MIKKGILINRVLENIIYFLIKYCKTFELIILCLYKHKKGGGEIA